MFEGVECSLYIGVGIKNQNRAYHYSSLKMIIVVEMSSIRSVDYTSSVGFLVVRHYWLGCVGWMCCSILKMKMSFCESKCI